VSPSGIVENSDARVPSAPRCSSCDAALGPDARSQGGRYCPVCIAESGAFPIQTLFDLGAEDLDDLPFGIVELDANGVVLVYNHGEEQISGRNRAQVVGRNFFSEVAPCTNVRDFAGKYRALVHRGRSGEASLEFVFDFVSASMLVWVQMIYSAPQKRGFLVVRRRA
jgi:photoactive yellow protein